MPNRSCPHCARRLPYAGRRCIHCGWTSDAQNLPKGAGISWWRRTQVWAVVVATFSLLVVQYAYRNATALADWYANFAARFLAEDASSFAPVYSETGAFVYCARQVARKMDGKFSVETFDGAATRTVALGDRRYRVQSVVEEALQTGREIRHDVTCTVRYERGRWILEDLKVERYTARGSPQLLAGPR